MNVNKAILCGRIVQAPVSKVTGGGYPICSFSLATNTVRKNKAGEKVEEVDFHNIVVFGRVAEVVAQYAVKGQLLFVEGRIRNTSYLVQDVKKYRSEVIVEKVQFGQRPLGNSAPANPATATLPPEHTTPIPVISDEVGADEVGADEVGADEVGADEVRVEDIPF